MRKKSARLLSLMLALTMLVLAALPVLPAKAANPKLIAITYDDGPGYYTSSLLDGLKARNVKATFFMLGQNAAGYSSTVARMYKEGHQIANHSYDHSELTSLSEGSVRSQFQRTNAILDKACGKGSEYMIRAPYGSVNNTVFRAAAAPLILWSVDPLDWKYRNADTVRSNIINQAHDGAIILVHDIHSTSIPGSLAAIDYLKSRGYEFVTVQELFRRRGKTPQDGVQYTRVSPTGTQLGPVEAPKITTKPEGGKLRVTITAQSGASVYYSTDGSDLNQESKKYTGPFLVDVPSTLKACAAFNMNGSRSDIVEESFTMPVANTPEIHIEDGCLTISCATPNAAVSYSLNDGRYQAYNGPVTLDPGTEVRAYAACDGFLESAKAYAVYSALGNVFTDVSPSQWYYEAIDKAAASGYMDGLGGGRFAPKSRLTRGQLAALLHRFAGEPQASGDPGFRDVAQEKYYSDAIAWARECGIVDGYADGTFRPDRPVSRQEMAHILFSFMQGLDIPLTESAQVDYADSGDIADWARIPVANLYAMDIMSGDKENRFNPQATASRAEAAAVLVRIAGYIESVTPAETPEPTIEPTAEPTAEPEPTGEPESTAEPGIAPTAEPDSSPEPQVAKITTN